MPGHETEHRRTVNVAGRKCTKLCNSTLPQDRIVTRDTVNVEKIPEAVSLGAFFLLCSVFVH